MFKKLCDYSIFTLTLLAFLVTPDLSFAMEGQPGSSDKQKVRAKHKRNSPESKEETGIHSLPIEVVVPIFEGFPPLTQATLRKVCTLWKDYIDGTPFLDILGKYNREYDRITDLSFHARKNPTLEECEKLTELLRYGKPSAALHQLLGNGRQDYLVYNYDKFRPFLCQAIAQDPAGLVRGMRHLSDNYPRIFHTYHPYLLQELKNVSNQREESGTPVNWGGDLLFLLDSKRVDYLLELRNRYPFSQLSPFFVRAIKEQALPHTILRDLCEEVPDAYDILLPSLLELLKTPDDFKNNFSFIANDPLTFSYLFPSLQKLIQNSEELQSTLKEIAKSTTDEQLKEFLAIHGLQEACGNQESKKIMSAYYNKYRTDIDEPQDEAGVEDEDLREYWKKANKGTLYGYPLWCAYFPQLDYWIDQMSEYNPEIEKGRNIPFFRRFAKVAAKIFNFNVTANTSLKKIGNEKLAEQNKPSLREYQKRLRNLKSGLSSVYNELGEKTYAYLSYSKMRTENISLLELVETIFDVYFYHSLFNEACELSNRVLQNTQAPGTTKMLMQAKHIDALFHLSYTSKESEDAINALAYVLDCFDSEDFLKATIPDEGEILEEDTPIEALNLGFISRQDVLFLKKCYEVRQGVHPLSYLLKELSTHMQSINHYFLRVQFNEYGQDYSYSMRVKASEERKVLFRQSIISRFLEVLNHSEYTSLNEETKLSILNILKPHFKQISSQEVAEEVSINPTDKWILTQSLRRYDLLLIKIFKADSEAAQNYQNIRLFLGIDLKEGEGQ